jgi:hypothetical protein
MPTTNKSPNLGLNNWVGTDKPKRSDFVEDNLLLDTILGNHLADKATHLSADDRTALEQPVATGMLAGNGQESCEFELPFAPRAIFVFHRVRPMSEYDPNKQYTYINAAAATTTANTPGILLGGNQVKLSQSQSAPQAGGYFLNMNCSSDQYFYIALR